MTARAPQEPVMSVAEYSRFMAKKMCAALAGESQGEDAETQAEWLAAERRNALMVAKPVPYLPGDRL